MGVGRTWSIGPSISMRISARRRLPSRSAIRLNFTQVMLAGGAELRTHIARAGLDYRF